MLCSLYITNHELLETCQKPYLIISVVFIVAEIFEITPAEAKCFQLRKLKT